MKALDKELVRLAEAEGWEVVTRKRDNAPRIYLNGKDYPLIHPYRIHLTLYRNSTDPDQKLFHFKRVHDLLWPDLVITHNYWEERMFRAHCEAWKQIVLAGGSGIGKSFTSAKIALIFWLSNPTKNSVIIASTTLESLESRIWGCVMKLVQKAALPIAAKILKSKPAKIVTPGQLDKIHGMFAIAIRQGDDEQVLSTIIGRHPEKGMLVVLDESTDMSPAIIKAVPNLEQGTEFCQLLSIGNSSDRNDLHGSLATPKHGWKSIDPSRDFAWETCHNGGICLYFNPEDSPAIHEKDPVKKIMLAKFLITKEELEEKKKLYGVNSTSFMRFVMGFWPTVNAENLLLSEQFLEEHQVKKAAEWLGVTKLEVLAGLDSELTIGGTGCILRLAVLGQDTRGKVVLDYRNEELLFRLQLQNGIGKSAEYQLAEQTIAKLLEYRVPLRNLTLDATGLGRAVGGLIKLMMGSNEEPLRILSARHSRRFDGTQVDGKGGLRGLGDFMKVMSPIDLWDAFKEFVMQDHIRGLDIKTIQQMVNRKVILSGSNAAGRVVKRALESKKEYKARMLAINPTLAHSPDEADAAVLVLQSAINVFGFRPGLTWAMPQSDGFVSLWQQKLVAFQREQELASVKNSNLSGTAKPRLCPDFAGTVEDSVQFLRSRK